jgi:hypothetical protein
MRSPSGLVRSSINTDAVAGGHVFQVKGALSKTFTMAPAAPKERKVAGAEDVAARYFVYKL